MTRFHLRSNGYSLVETLVASCVIVGALAIAVSFRSALTRAVLPHQDFFFVTLVSTARLDHAATQTPSANNLLPATPPHLSVMTWLPPRPASMPVVGNLSVRMASVETFFDGANEDGRSLMILRIVAD